MDEIKRFLAGGSCCAEALVRLGLKLRNEKNETFANASAALCNGLWSQMTCGALSGGAMLLAMFDKRKACQEMIPELTAWFDETYGMQYGSVNCEDIAPGLRHDRKLCSELIDAVGEKCLALLREYGLYQEDTP